MAKQEEERIEQKKAGKLQGKREAAEKQAIQEKKREIVREAREDQISRMRKEDRLKGIIGRSYETLVAQEPVRGRSGSILYFPLNDTGTQKVPQPSASKS